MKVTTVPASRFGWEGQTLEYVVKADGASELRVPEKKEEGLDVHILDTRQVDGGVEARVSVEVTGPVLY
jgi:hypothetical protein